MWGLVASFIRGSAEGLSGGFLEGYLVGGFVAGALTGYIAKHLVDKGVNKGAVLVVGLLTGFIGLMIMDFIWHARHDETPDEDDENNQSGGVVETSDENHPELNSIPEDGGGKIGRGVVAVLSLLLLASIVGNAYLYSSLQEKDDALRDLTAELSSLKQDYGKLSSKAVALEKELDKKSALINSYEKNLSMLEANLSSLSQSLSRANEKLSELEQQLSAKDNKISLLENQLENLKSNVSQYDEFHRNFELGVFYWMTALRNWDWGLFYEVGYGDFYYNQQDFENASYYYGLAADKYDIAKTLMLQAEEYFKTAKELAPPEYTSVIDDFLEAVYYGTKALQARYYVAKYMVDACDRYSKGDDDNGDYFVSLSNKKLEEYKDYEDRYNVYAAKINEFFGISK